MSSANVRFCASAGFDTFTFVLEKRAAKMWAPLTKEAADILGKGMFSAVALK